MSEELADIRVKIAEARGWTQIDPDPRWLMGLSPDPRNKSNPLRESILGISLDSMAEAEKTLAGLERDEYRHALLEICNPESDRLAKDWTNREVWFAIHATAEQKARAFLKAIEVRAK